jgi:hypothetical protein
VVSEEEVDAMSEDSQEDEVLGEAAEGVLQQPTEETGL